MRPWFLVTDSIEVGIAAALKRFEGCRIEVVNTRLIPQKGRGVGFHCQLKVSSNLDAFDAEWMKWTQEA